MPGVAFHPCHHRANHRAVDLVVAPVQHLIGFCQRSPAMRAGGRLRSDRFVGKQRQRTTAAPPTQAALARPSTLGFLRLVRLLTLRRRQTGIVRGFPRLDEPRFKLNNAPLGRLKALPKRADQGILLSVAQVVEVGKLGHAPG
jgi:hypothetical protein